MSFLKASDLSKLESCHRILSDILGANDDTVVRLGQQIEREKRKNKEVRK